MIPIKLSFNGEVRRVTLYSQEKLNFVTLRDAAFNLFPTLREKDLTFLWSDDECDLVCCSSSEEVEEAVRVMTAENKTTFRFNVSVNEPRVSGVTHPHVTCDGCGQSPIVGPRFKCTVREDFDLCSKCEASAVPPHPMVKIYDPSQAPTFIVVGVPDQEGGLHQFEHPGRFRGWGRRGCGRGRGGGGGRGCPWMRRQGEDQQQQQQQASASAEAGGDAGACAGAGAGSGVEEPCGGRGPRACHWARKLKKHGWNWDKLNSMLNHHVGETAEPLVSMAEEFLSAFMPQEDSSKQDAPVWANASTSSSSSSAAAAAPTARVDLDADQQILNDVLRMSLEESERQAAEQSAASSAAISAPVPEPLSVPAAPVPEPVSAPAPVSAKSLAMRFVADESLPDGSVVSAGSTFQKIWRVKNTGKVAWPSTVRLVSSGGDELVPVDSSFDVPAAEAGAEVSIAVTMTAPRHAGRHVAYFRLSVDGEFFGIRLWADIRVEEDEEEPWVIVSPSEGYSVAPSAPPAAVEAPTPVPSSVPVPVPVPAALVAEDVLQSDDEDEVSAAPAPAPAPAPVRASVPARVVSSGPSPFAPTPRTPVPVPVMVPAQVQSPWAMELNILAEMGFSDPALVMPLLQAHVNPAKPESERSRGLQYVIGILLG